MSAAELGAGPIPPEPTADSADFWAGCRDGVLRLPRCQGCGAHVFPPGPVCPVCHADALVPTEVAPRGRVYSFTVNHQPTRPGLDVPHALVLVDLDEAPGVRLTMRAVGPRATEVTIGDRVTVELEPVDDRWSVPVARIEAWADAPPVPHHAELGELAFSAPRSRVGAKPESAVMISGIGRSDVGRKLFRSDLDLAVEAALRAIADAGLTPADIDGIATYPGFGMGPPGYAGPHTDSVAASLGLELAWHRAGAEGAGQLQPVFDAVGAVAAGLCRHALVFRASTESTAVARMRAGEMAPPPAEPARGFTEWLVPFDALSPASWLAPYAQRHMHRFGTTRAHFGQVAVTARRHAALAPGAIYTEPLTLDDHAEARMIASPIGLYDCDVPVDGAVAVVISPVAGAADLPHPPVRVEAMGTGVGFVPSWHQWPDLTTMAAHGAAATMWARTDLGPADIDVAQLYDGFTFLALYWLEALGVCGHGESGPFVEGGDRIALGGVLPTNTGGGQLSGGRLHGWGLLHEACLQLRGEGGDRQVPGAEVAVTTTGGGPVGGCLLLTG